MISLEELIEMDKQSIINLSERIQKSKDELSHTAGKFYYFHVALGAKAIKERDFDLAKKNFNICAEVDSFLVKNYNSRLFDYGLNNVCYALLSDNEPLLQSYSQLRYHRGEYAEYSMDEMVAMGETPIWCNTMQMLISKDIEGVERNLNIIETKILKRAQKKGSSVPIDYEFYKALLTGNKAKMEDILETLLSPKFHKKRTANLVIAQYLSMPALGYAKLAWRYGFEVEVKSKLVPQELLPIKPLDKYDVPYDFLIER